jgi:YD repeat-containing protein
MTAPLGAYIVYGYDELDRLTTVQQVNRVDAPKLENVFATTALTYDLAGRKTGMTDPDMGAWTYTYDALGNLLTQPDSIVPQAGSPLGWDRYSYTNSNPINYTGRTLPNPQSPGYPNGYVSYYNRYNQTINPFTGKPLLQKSDRF